jgi:3',5'-cyclic-AMP phosphodiesterase
MLYNRRKFLQLTFKSAVVISAGNTLQSFCASDFVLPSKDKIRLRFAVASDGHYGQPNTNYDSMHDEMIGWLQAEQKDRGIDFTMINGDIYHDDIEMLPLVKQHWDKLGMTYYVSHGNHDKAAETVWQQTWNTKWHYSFEQQDAVFLVLNTADETGKYICPDLDRTKAQLEKHQSKKQLFVFMHITPFNWTKNGIPCTELTEMFAQQKNLKAIFHGHDHDQDNVKENAGKYYFFDGHIAGNWGTDYRGYRIVEILKTGEMITYQMNPASGKQVNSNKI